MSMKNILALVLVVLLIGGGYYAYQYTKKQPVADVTPKETPTTPFTADEVAKHNSEASCYTIVNGMVYDVTSWIDRHPGGRQAILGLCGKDGTEAFTKQHGGQSRPESTLATFKVGVLAQ